MRRTHYLRLIFVVGLTACSVSPAATSTGSPTQAAVPTQQSSPTQEILPTSPPEITPTFTPETITFPKIDRRPEAANYGRGHLGAMPSYDPASDEYWQVDLRGYDLSNLDLTASLDDLMYADFDSQTIWPVAESMPLGYDWTEIMELGKNPGLGIQDLHEQGITGAGVGIAIIDLALLADHQEYTDQLRLYEEGEDIQGEWLVSHMHGAAVASIAVGKTVGVAPDADLYYMATTDCYASSSGVDFTCTAQSVRRVIEINRQLPADRKIRVISMSIGWSESDKGYAEITAAVEAAQNDGIFVISSCISAIYGLKFQGLGRSPLANPDDFNAYEPGMWWAQRYYNGFDYSGHLLVPMDSRTTASPTGAADYVFYREGGWSWAIPYLAGMYALAVQVDPAITPDEFWSLALETGQTIQLTHDNDTFSFGTILDPVALIDALQSQE